MPVRRPLPSPVVVPRSSYFGSSARHDYGIDDSIDRVEYVSNAILDDTYGLARQSKNRDNELIRNTRAAIISTEQHASPRAAAVSRRMRASTAPPGARAASVQPAALQQSSYTKVEEEQLQARPYPAPRPYIVVVPANPRASPARVTSKPVVVARGGSVPPPEFAPRGIRAASVPPRPVAQTVLATSSLHAHRPYPLYKDVARRARAVSVGPAPIRASSVGPPQARRATFYGYPSAAIVAEEALKRKALPTSNLHAHNPRILRKDIVRLAKARADDYPRRFARAASEPRDLSRASDYYFSLPQEGIYYRSPIVTGVLHSSKPPLPKLTERKAIRDVDGFTKPRNVMSWQYRVESRLSPDDVIYQPSSYIRLREQVRDAQEKMDRQRQLLDRYLDVDNFSQSSSRKDATNSS